MHQEPRSTTSELMANPVQSTGVGSSSGVRTDTKWSRKPNELLNVKSLGEINYLLALFDVDDNAFMTSLSVVSD